MTAPVSGVLLTLLVATCSAGDFLEVVAKGRQPNHLVPVYHHDAPYAALVRERLLVTSGECGRMIFYPSFEPEFAVSVHSRDPRTRDPKRAERFQMTLTEAESSLYFSIPENRGRKSRKPGLVRVIRYDADVPREVAATVQRVWAAVLQQTRYPKAAYAGLDGATAEFSVTVRGLGVLEGEIWSPKEGLPAALMQMGFRLAKYCKATPEKRRSMLQDIRAELEKVEAQARMAEDGAANGNQQFRSE
jgi:hypothetical protein